MSKRSGSGDANKRNKKARYLPGAIKNVEPRYQGVYVSYTRGKENMAKNEVRLMMNEWCEKLYGTTVVENDEEDDDIADIDDIDKAMAAEVAAMKDTKKDLITPLPLGCECMLFVRTRKPIKPVEFVKTICQGVKDTGKKSTRFVQRMTPVTLTGSASKPELEKLCDIVLAPEFHQKEGQKPLKYAIRPTLRNFDGMTRDEVIQTVASRVGQDHGHSVDLKNYDKLILVDCFKASIGMAVVGNVEEYEGLARFNIEQLWERHNEKESGTSRVNKTEKTVKDIETKAEGAVLKEEIKTEAKETEKEAEKVLKEVEELKKEEEELKKEE
ncbi:tRNA acetyltransferase TAN1 [Yarrowia sp. C11]|nr:tRNA acetyltransferase TAN1 [Yarrowia sp. C11]KAG5364344.1 tRNA acetyltransferase TAN1 [Yarrowia sp. E02]